MTTNFQTVASQSAPSKLPAYKLTKESDRDNNAVTRTMTGSASNCIEGIRVTASERRDGKGAYAIVLSASRPGFAKKEFTADTWEDAFHLGAKYRSGYLSE